MLTPMRVRTPDKPHRISQDQLLTFDKEGTYIATAKYDGYRCIIDWDGKTVQFYSRRGTSEGNPRVHPINESLKKETLNFLTSNKIHPNTRLDAEWVERRTHKDPKIMVFGITYSGGKWLNEQEKVRWEIVKSLDYNQPHIQLAEYTTSNYSTFFHILKERDFTQPESEWELEGIVLKHVNSKPIGSPEASKKNPLWFKAKWRDTASGKVETY